MNTCYLFMYKTKTLCESEYCLYICIYVAADIFYVGCLNQTVRPFSGS